MYLYVAVCCTICLGIEQVAATAGPAWQYGVAEEALWVNSYPNCGGSAQSPIDIITDDVEYDECMGNIVYFQYNEHVSGSMTLANNGHSAQATLPTPLNQYIEQGGLPTTYQLIQFHFHWGSEHTIDGARAPLEAHFVHMAAKIGDSSVASQEGEGLAVLGFLFEIQSDNNTALNPIINVLDSVVYEGTNAPIAAFALATLFPTGMSPKFYRYAGSLTTPGCYESVVWTVFDQKIKISDFQLNKFKALDTQTKGAAQSSGSKPMVDNYRTPQPINGRKVYTNVKATAGALKLGLSVMVFVPVVVVELVLKM